MNVAHCNAKPIKNNNDEINTNSFACKMENLFVSKQNIAGSIKNV